MRKVIFKASVSLDGFIEGPNGELDWMVSEDEAQAAGIIQSAFDTIFYGRKAYERLGASDQMERDHSATEPENIFLPQGMRKYVFSRSQKHVEGNGMVISENLEAEVLRIREEKGKDILLCGGPDILKTFMRLDLVDEYLLMVHPVVLNSGKPLFIDMKKSLNLILMAKLLAASGVVILHYLPESRKGENNNKYGRSV